MRSIKDALAILIIGGALLLLGGCFGDQARANVLYPAMEAQWPMVRTNAEAGGVAAVSLEAMDTALAAQDSPVVVHLWDSAGMHESASDGLAQREATGAVPPVLAGSQREGIRQFNEHVIRLRGQE